MPTEHSFCIHGVDVRIAGDRPGIMEQTREELRFFECTPVPMPRIRVAQVQRDDLDVNAPDLAQRHMDPGDEINWIRGDIASVLNIPKRTLTLYVTASCPDDAGAVILFGTIGFLVHMEISLQGDLAYFHGALLMKNGRGVLLHGKTNSGKTSVSYLLQDHGFSYLSEEDSFIRSDRDGTLHILPYPRRIRISPRVMAKQPRLAELPHEKAFVASLDEEVFRVDPREPFPPRVPLGQVLLLDNDIKHLSVSLEPLNRAEAMLSLLASLEVARIQESPDTTGKELKTLNRAAYEVTSSVIDRMAVNRLT